MNRHSKGTFILIEGTDGSGKTLQAGLLIKRLKQAGKKVEQISFPQYGEPSAVLVEKYLNGEFGSASEVGPYRASILYAVDRFAAANQIKKWLKQGKIVIANRYVASNMGHQGGKIKNTKKRRRYLDWIYNLEYNILGIPKPDINLILHVTAKISQQLVDKKGERKYLKGKKRDIHEDDINHLRDAEKAYLEINRRYPEFKIIECVKNNKILPPQIIHEKICAKNIISKTVELYRQNYQLFLPYLFLLFLPTGIMVIVGEFFGFMLQGPATPNFSMLGIIYLLVLIIGSLATLWISLAFVRVIANRYENKTAQTKKIELQNVANLFWPALLISILTSLIIIGGFILLIVPGVIFAIWYAFSFYAVVLDQHKVMDALKTSKNLVQGRWWAVWWRLFAPTLVFVILLFLAQWLVSLPFKAILQDLSPTSLAYTLIVSILTLLTTFINLLFTPLTTAAPTILYLELKKTPLTSEKK